MDESHKHNVEKEIFPKESIQYDLGTVKFKNRQNWTTNL